MRLGLGLGLGNIAGRLGGAGQSYLLRSATNRTSLRNAVVASTAGFIQDNRILHRVTCDAPYGIVPRYAGLSFQAGGGGDLNQAATLKTVTVNFEYPVGSGILWPGKLNGATSFTIAQGQVVDLDPLPFRPSRGEFIGEQNSCSISGSLNFEVPMTALPSLGEYSVLRDGATNTSAAGYPPGDASAIPPASVATQAWGASVMMARSRTPGITILGSSIDDGSGANGDTIEPTTVENPGMPAHLISNTMGILRLVASGAPFTAMYAAWNCMNLAEGNNKYAWLGPPGSDILGAATLATIQARFAIVTRNLGIAGHKFIICGTQPPETQGTFTDYAGQSTRAGEAVRLAWNTWVKTQVGVSPTPGCVIAGVVDFDAAGDPSFPDKWPMPPFVAFTGSDDGIHPTKPMNDRYQTFCKSQFDAIIAACEALDKSPDGLGTKIRVSYPQPTKKTAQICAGGPIQWWQKWDGTNPLALTNQANGSASGWTYTRGAQGFSSGTNGPLTNANLAEFPDYAMISLYRMTTIAVVGTISGLDPAKTYNLAILCSMNVAGYNTNLNVSGLVAQTQRVVTALNNYVPEKYNNIQPDAGGNISVSTVRATGASFGAWNAMRIEEN